MRYSRPSRTAATSVSVSLRKVYPSRDELGLDLGEVLDDPVVDDGELVVVGQVRVRVGVGRPAVRRPAGVADAGGAVRHRRRGEIVAQDAELAGPLAHPEVALAVDHGDARGVVAAVLQTREPGQEDGLALPRAHVSDDSTHASNGRRRVMRGACTNEDQITGESDAASSVTACAAAPARPCGRRPSPARASPGAWSAARSPRGSAG